MLAAIVINPHFVCMDNFVVGLGDVFISSKRDYNCVTTIDVPLLVAISLYLENKGKRPL